MVQGSISTVGPRPQQVPRTYCTNRPRTQMQVLNGEGVPQLEKPEINKKNLEHAGDLDAMNALYDTGNE